MKTDVNGINVEVAEKEFDGLCILKASAGTTGRMGGDTGHGGRTYIKFENITSTDMNVSADGADFGNVDSVVFSSYCEKLREYAREYLNVEIPDPDKFWRAKKYKSYSEQHGK